MTQGLRRHRPQDLPPGGPHHPAFRRGRRGRVLAAKSPKARLRKLIDVAERLTSKVVLLTAFRRELSTISSDGSGGSPKALLEFVHASLKPSVVSAGVAGLDSKTLKQLERLQGTDGPSAAPQSGSKGGQASGKSGSRAGPRKRAAKRARTAATAPDATTATPRDNQRGQQGSARGHGSGGGGGDRDRQGGGGNYQRRYYK